MDRATWQVTVHEVSKSWTGLLLSKHASKGIDTGKHGKTGDQLCNKIAQRVKKVNQHKTIAGILS